MTQEGSMNFKLLVLCCLLPAMVAGQTPTPSAKSATKKAPPKKEAPAANAETPSRPMDNGDYEKLNQFLFPSNAKAKEKLSQGEKILAGIATAASAACAGIAAAQWFDAQAKDQKAKEAASKTRNK
jgi:hypothetical protein